MKNYFCKSLSKSSHLVIFFIFLLSLKGNFLNAEYLLKEFEIDASTKAQEDSSVLPTNPFEIVEMIRKHNSMNDATNPSDAIDEALKSFSDFEEKKEI